MNIPMNIPGISFNEADGKVLLVCQPAERVEITSVIVHGLLVEAGFGTCLMDEAAIASAANLCNVQKTPFGLEVAQRLDAHITVQVALDDMCATLDIVAPRGGKPASVSDALSVLIHAGVVFGIDEQALASACAQGACTQHVVARGQLAEDGRDATFEALIPETIDRAPKLNDQGLIDYRERGEIPVVQAGAELMRRLPATPGTPGQTVKGRILAAVPGQNLDFAAKLDGAQVSPNDPNLLIASVSGQPVLVQAGVMVEPLLRLKEVNMATGNVHFDGTVHIAGDVVQSMKVQASGDIVVDGMVEGGQLNAGGNIQVAGGVIAHAQLHAAGSVTARFAEGVTIHAGTLIAIGDMVLDCQLHSRNQVIVGANAPQRGRLVGGCCTAAMLLQVPWLGSSKAPVTKVVVGANPELEAKYAALLQRIEEDKANEANLDKLMKQLKATGDPKHLLDRVKASRQRAVQVWGQDLADKRVLENEMAQGLAAKVTVTQGVQGAVNLQFGHTMAHLSREYDAGCFTLGADGKLAFAALDAAA